MTAGRDLLGDTPNAPRRRGRPPGSKGKRAADLKAYVTTVTGSTAAMQSAQLCLVTVKELKAAGGDHAKAVVAKAARHVAAYEAAADGLDQSLRDLIAQELRLVMAQAETTKESAMMKAVQGAIERISAHAGRFTLAMALDAISEERRALMPYTDQRQPQVVHAKGEGFAPAVVIVGGGGGPIEQNQGVIEGAAFEVLQPTSHALPEPE